MPGPTTPEPLSGRLRRAVDMSANFSLNPSRRNEGLQCVVRMGGESAEADTWRSGDGVLMEASVTLAEGERVSTCTVRLHDPDFSISEKYLHQSILQGGVVGLPEEDKETGKGAASPYGGVADTTISVKVQAFLLLIRYAEGTSGPAGYRTITGGGKFESFKYHPGTRNPNLYRETGLNSDASGAYQFISTTWEPIAKKLGLKDFSPTSQDKGAVELIRQKSYLDEIERGGPGDLEKAIYGLAPTWASFPSGPQARTSIEELKSQYLKYVTRLDPTIEETARAEPDEEDLPRNRKAGGATRAQEAAKAQAAGGPKEEKPIEGVQRKGCEIRVWLSFGERVVEFGFIHTETSVQQQSGLRTVQFIGHSVRWLMTRRLKNTAFQSISLKQLAEKVARSYNMELVWEGEGDGVKFTYLSQDGITDYQLIYRESQKLGYRIYDDVSSKKLYIAKRQGKELAFVVRDGETLRGFQMQDAAQKDEGGETESDGSASGTTGELKVIIDPLLGSFVQKVQENKTATGNATTDSKFLTGATKEKLSGSYDERARDDVIAARREAAKRIRGIRGSCDITTTDAVLELNPDMFMATEGEAFPGAMSRTWLIDTVRHKYPEGTTSITFYSPGRPKKESPTAGVNGEGAPISGEDLPPIPAGEWRLPMPLAGNSTMSPGGLYGDPRGYGGHVGTDVGGFGEGLKADHVYAMRTGKVTKAGGPLGELKVLCSDGWSYRYLHMTGIRPSVGQYVEAGQYVGTRSNVATTEIHLHVEVMTPSGGWVDPRSVQVKEGRWYPIVYR